jgi:DNA-binding NtrC family response regulator
MIFDAVARCSDGSLTVDHFQHLNPTTGRTETLESIRIDDIFDSLNPLPTIHHTVRTLIQAALKRARGNQSVAAQFLGISQPALSKRLKLMQED